MHSGLSCGHVVLSSQAAKTPRRSLEKLPSLLRSYISAMSVNVIVTHQKDVTSLTLGLTSTFGLSVPHLRNRYTSVWDGGLIFCQLNNWLFKALWTFLLVIDSVDCINSDYNNKCVSQSILCTVSHNCYDVLLISCCHDQTWCCSSSHCIRKISWVLRHSQVIDHDVNRSLSCCVNCVQSDGGPPDARVWLQTGAPLCHQVPQSCHGRRVGQGGTKLSLTTVICTPYLDTVDEIIRV